MEEEIMTRKSELAEMSIQLAQLRGEAERHDVVHSTHISEIERLRMALQLADHDILRQAQQLQEKTRGLTKEHVDAMDTRNKSVAEEVARLTKQWQADVGARDLRIEEMETIVSDLQKTVRMPV